MLALCHIDAPCRLVAPTGIFCCFCIPARRASECMDLRHRPYELDAPASASPVSPTLARRNDALACAASLYCACTAPTEYQLEAPASATRESSIRARRASECILANISLNAFQRSRPFLRADPVNWRPRVGCRSKIMHLLALRARTASAEYEQRRVSECMDLPHRP